MTRNPLPRRQAGLTLVELMISMVIGMVIVLAVITAYISASRAARVAEATGRMNEDAQAALTILTQQLRMAGANPAQPNRNTTTLHNELANPFSIRGCDTTFSNITSATSTVALTCPAGTGTSAISVAYEADKYNTIATSAGVPTDCLGNALTGTTTSVVTSLGVAANATVYQAENRYYIGTSTNIISPSLYCKGNSPNTSAQPLVENIEAMRLTYGVSNPGRAMDYGANSPNVAANFILGYLPASDMVSSTVSLTGSATFTLPPLGGLTGTVAFPTTSFTLRDLVTVTGFSNQAGTVLTTANLPGTLEWKAWKAVKAVRVCVVVRSEGQLLSSEGGSRVFTEDLDANPRYVDCDGNLVTAPDRRLRRAYTTTVVLRNQSP